MADLLDRARTQMWRSERNSVDSYIQNILNAAQQQFAFGGNTYGLQMTLRGHREGEIAWTLPGYLGALRRCPPAFAAQMVRAITLAQARFVWRNRPGTATPRRIHPATACSQDFSPNWAKR